MSRKNTVRYTLTPESDITDVINLNEYGTSFGFVMTANYTNLTSGVLKFFVGADPDYLNEVTDWQITCDTSSNNDTLDQFTNAKYLKIQIVGVGSFSCQIRVAS